VRITASIAHSEVRDQGSTRGFTRADLIALFALLLVLFVFLAQRLAKGSQQVSNGIQCLNNARQLAFAAHLYAADNRDLWPANGNSDPSLNLENPPPQYVPRVWIERSENLFSKQQADGTISPKVSLLAHYIPDRRILRCPGDTHLLGFGNTLFLRPRNYGLNLFIAWPQSPFAQTWHGEPMGKNRVFSKRVQPANQITFFFLAKFVSPLSVVSDFKWLAEHATVPR
jgi:hypothetical protein